ncbi:PREDICTED: probable aminoacyl tRNA synthase complex-interacting multifunctional protein 2 [Nicrophorus vespilloides]|uniref:Probable aminoacyl tRNA synthase complex-interacting multifunctional protein 2 n=1 Tax=Nicrophorus vespilloides TaxID=110193 RepID=A0ABM1MCC2_NICVS|nr:PREDICTED: probable aminoacyl tRNA synthase complex-interacting multifunctional protein 2 [Nicrophorus vespilloides]
MSGGIKMYAARQIVRHDLPVELPNCMYTLANIHRNGVTTKASATKVATGQHQQQQPSADISEQVKLFLKNNSDLRGMAALESKQQQLLKQLEELKQQMLGIKDDLKAIGGSTPVSKSTCKKSSSAKTVSNKSLKVSNIPDIVINVQKNADAPKISVRLIWKNIGFNQMELMVCSVPILDECNFLRHICRLTGGLSYDEKNFEIDDLLDLSYSIAKSQTKQKRMELMQLVNKRLGKSDFLLGETGFGVADVALYSAIKQVAQGAEINVNLTRWMKNCEAA